MPQNDVQTKERHPLNNFSVDGIFVSSIFFSDIRFQISKNSRIFLQNL